MAFVPFMKFRVTPFVMGQLVFFFIFLMHGSRDIDFKVLKIKNIEMKARFQVTITSGFNDVESSKIDYG